MNGLLSWRDCLGLTLGDDVGGEGRGTVHGSCKRMEGDGENDRRLIRSISKMLMKLLNA